jgi:hypothetical protein
VNVVVDMDAVTVVVVVDVGVDGFVGFDELSEVVEVVCLQRKRCCKPKMSGS